MTQFHLHYDLTRRQRLAAELYPWLPCLAACLGFTLGVGFLSVAVSRWFLPLLLLPPVVSRRFVAFLVGLAAHPTVPVDVTVDGDDLNIRRGDERWRFPLAGIIQVFRSEDAATWTVLHVSGAEVVIPAAAITADHLDYLKGFARRAADARREHYPA